jgi:hypothetical protein
MLFFNTSNQKTDPTNQFMKNKTKIGLMALLAGLTAGQAMAGTLTSYATGDVLICFRNGGGNDLVVDAGPISTFTSLSANQRYVITAYTGSQLAQVSTNSLDWSAFTWGSDNTLYVTKPRSSLNTQTSPWYDGSYYAQQGTADRMNTITLGAVDEAGFSGVNTATAVIEEDISAGNPDYPTGVSYHDALFGASPNPSFNGTFQGNPENTTTNHFTIQGKVVRSDFYQLTPTGGFGLANFLGYFEFNTNGVMTYVAYPSATPAFTSISRAGSVNTINYTTGLYGTYTLRGTNNLVAGASPTSWPALQTLSSGDTSVHLTTDTTADPVRYYTITAQ